MSENIKERAILLSVCLQKDSYEQKLKSLDELERLGCKGTTIHRYEKLYKDLIHYAYPSI